MAERYNRLEELEKLMSQSVVPDDSEPIEQEPETDDAGLIDIPKPYGGYDNAPYSGNDEVWGGLMQLYTPGTDMRATKRKRMVDLRNYDFSAEGWVAPEPELIDPGGEEIFDEHGFWTGEVTQPTYTDVSGIVAPTPKPYAGKNRQVLANPEGEEGWYLGKNLIDLVGNTVWGIAEGFGAWVPDMASGGEMSKFMGSDDWADESIWGKIGYSVGTGLSMLFGIGLVGKGLQWGSKAFGFGVKAATKSVADDLTEYVAKTSIKKGGVEKLVKSARAQIQAGKKEALKGVTWGARLTPMNRAAALARGNPLSNEKVYKSVYDSIKKDLNKKLGLNLDDAAVDKVTKKIMEESSNSLHKHFGHSIGHIMAEKGLSSGKAKILSDMVYEAVLLSAYDGIMDMGMDLWAQSYIDGDDVTAKSNIQQGYEFTEWWKPFFHGAVTGSFLGMVRHIKGGKKVDLMGQSGNRSGMINDLGIMRKAIMLRLRNVNNMGDRQMTGFLNTLFHASDGAIIKDLQKIATEHGLQNVGKLGRTFLEKISQQGYKYTKADKQILRETMTAIQKTVLGKNGLLAKTAAEIRKDAIGSFGRATLGSIVMAGWGYYDMGEKGLLPWQTDEATKKAGYHPDQKVTWDKLFFDHIVGMFYMKRGKNAETNSRFFYEVMGDKPILGSEVGRMSKAMEIFGYKDSQLQIFNHMAHSEPGTAIMRASALKGIYADKEIVGVIDKMGADLVDAQQYIEIVKRTNVEGVDPSERVDNWHVHVKDHLSNLETKIRDAKKKGDTKEQAKLEKEQMEVHDAMLFTEKIQRLTLFDINNKSVRPMTRKDALNFIQKYKEITLSDGAKINVNNFDVLDRMIEDGAFQFTRKVENVGLDFIFESLEILDLIDPTNMTKGAKINKSTLNALEAILTSNTGGEKGVTDKIYETAYALREAMLQANKVGLIELSDAEGRVWDAGRKYNAKELAELQRKWNDKTEEMHELVFNTMGVESSWRAKITGFQEGDGRFQDNYMLGSTPIWHSIQSSHIHKRNAGTMRALTGKDAKGQELDYFNKIQKMLAGKEGFEIVSDQGGVIEFASEKQSEFLGNFNSAMKMLQGGQGKGLKKITISELEALMNESYTIGGNVFQNTTEFMAFRSFLNRSFVESLTGNKDLSVQLRAALTTLISNDNLLVVRLGNQVKIRDSKSLEAILMKNANTMTEVELKTITEMLETYRKDFEIPMRNALGKTNQALIKFGDGKMVMDQELSNFNVNDIKQMITEINIEVNKKSLFQIQEFSFNAEKLRVNVADLQSKASEYVERAGLGEVTKEMKQAIKDVFDSYTNFEALLTHYHNTNDVMGLQKLTEKAEMMHMINRKGESWNGKDINSIREIKTLLDTYVKEVRVERDQALRLDETSDLDAYEAEQMAGFNFDRSGRIKKGSVTVSKSQYETKWNLEKDFMDTLVETPKTAMKGLGLSGLNSHVDLHSPVDGVTKTKYKDLMEKGLVELNKGNFTERDFIDIVIKPFVNAKSKEIEQRIKADKEVGGTVEEFIQDTHAIVQSMLSTKKGLMGTFENGSLNIKQTTFSNWDRGVNRLENVLGLEGQIITLAQRVGTSQGYSSKLSPELIAHMESIMSGKGTWFNPDVSEVLKSQDVQFLESIKDMALGTGNDGRAKFVPIRLDEKSMILISFAGRGQVLDAWADPSGKLRKKLVDVVAAGSGWWTSKSKAESLVNKYLSENLKAGVDGKGIIDNTNPNIGDIQTLVLLTRILESPMASNMAALIKGNKDMFSAIQEAKYLKLDSPKNGKALSERNLKFTKEYGDALYEQGSDMHKLHQIFKERTFNEDGTLKKHRTVNILDESGANSKNHFSTEKLMGEGLREQIKRDNPDLDKNQIEKRMEEYQEQYKRIQASAMNGEKYLSRDAMIQMLMANGATKDWFIWGDVLDTSGNVVGKEVVGFNVALKPIEMHHSVEADGTMSFHIGKTAYKYHPLMDKLMRYRSGDKAGSYIVESIGFESSHKVHAKFTPGMNSIEKTGYDLPAGENKGKFFGFMEKNSDHVRDGINIHRMNLDLESIMIKSVSSNKDAVVSSGFTTFMSSSGVKSLNMATGLKATTKSLMDQFANLSQSPWAYKDIISQIKNYNKETGDNITGLFGIDAVLNANGLPIFEYMMPQIQKVVVSDHMGTRNAVSSNLAKGSNNVMTAGDGYSFAERRGGVQYKFGGSGMSGYEAGKSVRDFFTKTADGKIVPSGVEGLNLIFKVTPELAKKFRDIGIEAGVDIAVVFDATTASGIRVLGPHIRDGFGNRKTNKARIEEFETQMENSYKEIMKELYKEYTKYNDMTVGELTYLLAGGSVREYRDGRMEFKDTNLSSIVEGAPNGFSPGILSNIGSGANFRSVHLGKTDLRTPKIGLNDFVMTRVEKTLDKRRGPVSEMNLKDVLDPQDADFDLDKSSSMHALPGRTLADIYSMSGYMTHSQKAFETALNEVRLDNHGSIQQYTNTLQQIEGLRAGLMRQNSILSTMLMHFSAKETTGNPLFRPGQGKQAPSDVSVDPRFQLTTFMVGNKEYKISIREGGDLASSIGYMKNLIKATIDIYKKPQDVTGKELDKLIWENFENGFLQITEVNSKGKATKIDYAKANKEVREKFNHIRDKILKPVGELHNLQHMTEHFADGTSRRMSPQELVYKYEKILTDIHFAGKDAKLDANNKIISFKNNDFAALTSELLSFLGGGKNAKNMVIDSHPMPVVQVLMSLKKGMSSPFGDASLDYGIGTLMMTENLSQTKMTESISKMLSNQKALASIHIAQSRLDGIKSIMENYERSGRKGSDQYVYWEVQAKTIERVINEFNRQVSDPTFTFGNGLKAAKRQDGSKYVNDVTFIYRGQYDTNGKFKSAQVVRRANPGELIYWKKGDVVVTNPKRIEAGNDHINKVRRAEASAFGRVLLGQDGNILALEKLVKDFSNKVREIPNELIDPNSPMTSDKFNMINEFELRYVADIVDAAMSIGGKQSAQQVLMMLMTPRLKENVFNISGYNVHQKSAALSTTYQSNKRNERMVLSYLERAMNGKASTTLEATQAREIYEWMNTEFKKAFVKQWDPTRQGDIFTFQQNNRRVEDFSLLNPLNDIPSFMTSKEITKKSREVMQAYLTGTYFMDPAALYRFTLGMKGAEYKDGTWNIPGGRKMHNVIEGMWEGTSGRHINGDGGIYIPNSVFRKSDPNFVRRQNKDSEGIGAGIEKIESQCFGN